jgi:hypothetical protein
LARSKLVDLEVTRGYHCITCCVRRAFFLGEGGFDRKHWLERRMRELSVVFAISVAGFSVLGNHLHVLVRLHRARHFEAADHPGGDRQRFSRSCFFLRARWGSPPNLSDSQPGTLPPINASSQSLHHAS